MYSYSFSALPPSASQCAKNRKRFIMRQGIDFVKRVRSQLEDRTTRRFSNPDLGEAPNWRPGYWSSYNTPRTSIDLDSSSIRDFLAGSDKRQNSRRSSMEWTSLTPIYEIDNNTRASNAMPPLPETTPSYYSRALHVPTRFLPQNQAILTSDIKGSILLFNDIASLCFRIDRSYIGRSILDMIDVSFHKQINKVMKRNDILHEITHTKDSKDSVLMCGVVVIMLYLHGSLEALRSLTRLIFTRCRLLELMGRNQQHPYGSRRRKRTVVVSFIYGFLKKYMKVLYLHILTKTYVRRY